MADKMTQEQRSNCMRRIKSKNTRPEMLVRRFLFSHGFRYRIHVRQLPGTPDLVIVGLRTCIFINGCFWHGHEGCKYYAIPKTNTEFWINKVKRNKARDHEVQRLLASMGWHSIVIWECDLNAVKRESTLESLLFTLNKIFLQDHSIKHYEMPEEEPMIAAEE